MNKKGENKKGFAKKLIALMLCCFCLLGAIPTAAMAFDADDSQMAGQNSVVNQSDDSSDEAGSATVEAYHGKLTDIQNRLNALTAETPDLQTELGKLEEEYLTVAYEIADLWEQDSITEEEYNNLIALAAEIQTALDAMKENADEPATLAEYNGTLTIQDTIKTNGLLTVTASGLAGGQKATFVWEKQAEGSSEWVAVERRKVTGDSYNMAEDGSWLNVALDGGARATYRVKIATIDGAEVTNDVTASGKVTYYAELQNGSFESPDYNVENNSEHFYTSGTTGLVWQTTDTKGEIEFVIPGNNSKNAFWWHGVSTAYDGDQCAEINANSASALYQDVLTTPGSTMYWQLAHLGRSMNGAPVGKNNRSQTDTMYVLIMPTKLAEGITTQAQVQRVLNNLSSYPGAKVETITYTWRWSQSGNQNNPTYTMQHLVNGNWVDTYRYTGSGVNGVNYTQLTNPWETHSGEYTVPEGQYLTRYFFVAGSTAHGGDNSVGNHIDRVHFSTSLPPANPGSVSLTIKKTIDVDGWNDMTEAEQNKFKESITFNVSFGQTSLDQIKGSQMNWVGNVGTYNIQNYSIGSASSIKATVTESVSQVDGYNVTSDKPTWTEIINEGGTGTAEFTNHYTPAMKELTIKKLVTGNMYDEKKKFTFTVTADKEMTYGETKDTTITFELGKDDTATITVPVGANVTVSENPDGYVYSFVASESTISGYTEIQNGVTFTMPADNATVVINNLKEVIVDTGVILETMPYVIILAVVAVGAILFLKKRRTHVDD